MLYLALYVSPGEPPFPHSILDEPDIACYVKGWGRPGDWGLLARDGETSAGAIWLRQWADRPEKGERGYGYVSSAFPEVSIALKPEYRNLGWGTRMFEQVISMARDRYPGLSLSVVRTSPALHLYRRLGFRQVGIVQDSLVMLLEWKNDG
jgi:ribosomal protein S18 acetylase RimI-like enzyme